MVSCLSGGSALELWRLAVATQIAKLLESCQCVFADSWCYLVCVPFFLYDSFSLSCAVLPCALVKYLVYRMAYDESTAWFRVLHCLKPPRNVS